MRPLRVGLMVPANNTTMERELIAWLPEGSTCRTLKIPRGEGLLTRETVPAYVESALGVAASFVSEELDAVLYGCTAAGFIMGPAADATLAEDLARATRHPVITTARAMIQALEDSQAKRIAVVTPYTEAVNRHLAAFLETSGIHVNRLNTLGATNTEELGRIGADQVAALARQTVAAGDDALFIACSQLPTFSILDGLRAECACPVWSSILATAWQARRSLADGAGR
jgi:maleate cis-trans isomerase